MLAHIKGGASENAPETDVRWALSGNGIGSRGAMGGQLLIEGWNYEEDDTDPDAELAVDGYGENAGGYISCRSLPK